MVQTAGLFERSFSFGTIPYAACVYISYSFLTYVFLAGDSLLLAGLFSFFQIRLRQRLPTASICSAGLPATFAPKARDFYIYLTLKLIVVRIYIYTYIYLYISYIYIYIYICTYLIPS